MELSFLGVPIISNQIQIVKIVFSLYLPTLIKIARFGLQILSVLVVLQFKKVIEKIKVIKILFLIISSSKVATQSFGLRIMMVTVGWMIIVTNNIEKMMVVVSRRITKGKIMMRMTIMMVVRELMTMRRMMMKRTTLSVLNDEGLRMRTITTMRTGMTITVKMVITTQRRNKHDDDYNR